MPIFSSTIIDHVANTMSQPYYRFDGLASKITVADNPILDDIFSNGGTISAWIYPTSSGEGDLGEICQKGESNAGFQLRFVSAKKLYFFQDWSTSNYYFTMDNATIDYDKWYHIVVTYNGSATANTASFYINGTEETAITHAGSRSGTINSDDGDAFLIGSLADGSRTWDGHISNIKLYNNVLTATEVKELYSGASVPFKYKGANQTELVTGGDMSSAGSWTVGGTTSALTINNNSDGLLKYDDSASVNITQNLTIVKGKHYRLELTVSNLVGGAGYLRFSVISDGGIWTKNPFKRVDNDALLDYTSWTAGTHSIDVYAVENATKLGFAFAETHDAGDVDNISLKRIGAVAEYDGSGMGASRWDDKSGNDLHGTVSGATVENAPADADSGLTYEEGTMTPTILLGGNEISTSSGTYNASQTMGSYTKIGNRVFFNMRVGITNKGGRTGDLRVAGLPFAPAASPNAVSACSLTFWNITYADTPFANIDESSTSIGLFETLNSGAFSTLTNSNIASGTVYVFIQVAGHYHI